MSNVLFAGPSIHGLGLRSSSALTILPPAACGDILKAVRVGVRAIEIVDGLFSAAPSIWHKEILLALSKGVRVLGASSLGALRAAECDHFGMEGVGGIYADYRDGKRTEDADVALLHGPAEMDYCPLTVPLVDAEATIEELQRQDKVSPADAERLLASSHELHFSERTWSDIVASAGFAPSLAGRVASDINRCKVERKKQDALELVGQMHASADRRHAPAWTLNRTYYLTVLEARIR